MKHFYGRIPDAPDLDDHLFDYERALRCCVGVLPAEIDLTPGLPAAYDQGQLGSCVLNASCGAIEYDRIKQGVDHHDPPSRLFPYYNTRKMERTTRKDAGCQIRDAIKSLATLGVCPESECPYDIKAFAKKPAPECYSDALKRRITEYQRVEPTVLALRTALAAGFPVIFGIPVYESFESEEVAKTGVVPMPAKGEQELGGHGILLSGHSMAAKRFKIRNSWGPDWGDQGNAYLPEEYVTGLGSDFWTIQAVAYL